MKICLVTTFPPSQGGLSEYGLHIARELQRIPFIRLTVLADVGDSSDPARLVHARMETGRYPGRSYKIERKDIAVAK